MMQYTHTEFFAGVGGVSKGLKYFETIWANDISPMKCNTLKRNHPNVQVRCDDISNILPHEFPLSTLASATYPCTNTSCAGSRTGLLGEESGLVYRWLHLLEAKQGAKHYPLAMLENPTGLIARNGGSDLRDLVLRLNDLGYSVNLSIVDAFHFVPQSRPRIFISCIKKRDLSKKAQRLTKDTMPACKVRITNPLRKWLHNNLDLDLFTIDTAPFPVRTLQLEHVIDRHNDGYWADEGFSQALVDGLTDVQRERFDKLVNGTKTTISAVARRGRQRADGSRFNATEINISGLCPAQRPYKGGSSRTWVLIAGQGQFRFKCVSPRESARLMGFDDNFILPESDKDAYGCTGDSVCPQAVTWTEENILLNAYKRGRIDTTQMPLFL